MRRLTAFLLLLCLILGGAAALGEGYRDDEIPPGYDGPGGGTAWPGVSLSVGQTLTFGRFEQDNNTGNGPEPILWRVLAVEGRQALVVSVRSLTGMAYNTSQTAVTWETCSLRAWLNGPFLQTAFTPDEQRAVSGTLIDNGAAQGDASFGTYGGNDTWDRVFLLSRREVSLYFDGSRMDARREAWPDRLAAPTRYARAQGAYCPEYFLTDGGEYAGWWWLRSPGSTQSEASYIDNNGPFRTIRVNKDTGGVRPAMWISMDALIF